MPVNPDPINRPEPERSHPFPQVPIDDLVYPEPPERMTGVYLDNELDRAEQRLMGAARYHPHNPDAGRPLSGMEASYLWETVRHARTRLREATLEATKVTHVRPEIPSRTPGEMLDGFYTDAEGDRVLFGHGGTAYGEDQLHDLIHAQHTIAMVAVTGEAAAGSREDAVRIVGMVSRDEYERLLTHGHVLSVEALAVAEASPAYDNAQGMTDAYAEALTHEAKHAVRVITGPLRLLGVSFDHESLFPGTEARAVEVAVEPARPTNVLMFADGYELPAGDAFIRDCVYCDKCGRHVQWRDGAWHHTVRGQRHRADVPPVIGVGIDKGRCGRCNAKMRRMDDGKWHHKHPGQRHRAVVA